jgi:serine/threonine-protein kinase
VGPYEVLARLGAGGMGEVFLGHDPRLQRRVALKCLTAPETQAGHVRMRIMREARAAARLNHPNIAAVFDVLEQDDRTFIVMEYVEGESLAARLSRGRLPIDEVRSIGRQLASALATAHGQGVIHRDLKPANIQMTRDGSIKVLDFGVAKLAAVASDATTAPTLPPPLEPTLTGSPGTPIYMSPEQMASGDIDGRSDIYSAGVLLFEMATGQRPFYERGPVALALAVLSRPAPAPSSIDPTVPADLDAVIAKALERDPAERFQNARELESALASDGYAREPTHAGPGLLDRAASTPRTAKRSRRVLAGTLALIAVFSAIAARGPIKTLIERTTGARTANAAVLAVLPPDNAAGDATSEYLGSGLVSLVVENFGAVPGMSVLSRTATAPYRTARENLDALQRELGASLVLDVRVKSPPPQGRVDVRLRRPADRSPIWEATLTGDLLSIERGLLEGLAGALNGARVWRGGLTPAEWDRLKRVPTTSAEALSLYAEARALLDRSPAVSDATRAVELLIRALSIAPAFALARAALGDAYLSIYRVSRDPSLAAKATDAVEQAVRDSPDAAAVYYSLGNVQWATGRYQDAIGALQRSLQLQPDSDEAHRLLGRVYFDSGDTVRAIQELHAAIRIRPASIRNYMELGSVTFAAGRYPEALDAYRGAANLQPNEPAPFSGLGLVYHTLGNLSEAIGNYEHAVRLGPSATAYSNLGLAYYSAARYVEAVDAWKRALDINPRSVLYHRNIGDAYGRLHRGADATAAYDRAIAIGEELLTVNRRDSDTIALVAVCEAKARRQAAAARHAAEAVALAPASRIALQRSAEVHALIGDSAAALRDLRSAIERGYGRRQARENDEFESLRQLPAFQALVAEPPVGGAKER